jgi:hypothetical protein
MHVVDEQREARDGPARLDEQPAGAPARRAARTELPGSAVTPAQTGEARPRRSQA